MVHEPIDGRQCHGLVGENLAPFAAGPEPRDKGRRGRLSDLAGRNVSEA
jgi:hypothetical protein